METAQRMPYLIIWQNALTEGAYSEVPVIPLIKKDCSCQTQTSDLGRTRTFSCILPHVLVSIREIEYEYYLGYVRITSITLIRL